MYRSTLRPLRYAFVLCLAWSILITAAAGAQQTPQNQSLETPADDGGMLFVEDVGQYGASHAGRFSLLGGPYTMWLQNGDVWITLQEPVSTAGGGQEMLANLEPRSVPTQLDSQIKGTNVRLHLEHANPAPGVVPFNPIDTNISYFLGNDPAKWRSDVPVWGGVRYQNVFDGVDLVVAGDEGGWRWFLECKAGDCATELADVRLQVDGAEGISLAASGAAIASAQPDVIAVQTNLTTLTIPLLGIENFSTLTDAPHLVATDIVVSPFADKSAVAVATTAAAASSDLIFSTLLGGSRVVSGDSELNCGLAVDSAGSSYIAGKTASADFPTTPGAFSRDFGAPVDSPWWTVVVVKMAPSGDKPVFATFLGDNGASCAGVAVDQAGNVYVAGSAAGDFPTTPSAYFDEPGTLYITKLKPSGAELAYSARLDSASSQPTGLAVDSSGAAYLVGRTISPDFPVTNNTSLNGHDGYDDGFVFKLNPEGSAPVYATYFGGAGEDSPYEITVDEAGCAFAVGDTTSGDFPTTDGAYDRFYKGIPKSVLYSDAFITKFGADGALIYSSYLGGAGHERALAVAVDVQGAAYVTGYTFSSDFPVTSGAYDTTHSSLFGAANTETDAFVTKLVPDGHTLAYSTFIGAAGTVPGWAPNIGNAIAVDTFGAVYVAGTTSSLEFPTTPLAYERSLHGGFDTFIVKLNATGSRLLYGTYLGGGGNDIPSNGSIALGTDGAVFVAGQTKSSDFPTTAGAYDTHFDGSDDIFVAKLNISNRIVGHVTLGSDLPLAGVTVRAGGQQIATDSQGDYVISQLPPGTYNVTAEKVGYDFSVNSRVATVPGSVPIDFQAQCSGSQWIASYYSDISFTGAPHSVRCESNVDYYWPASAKVGGTQQSASNFSVRWTRTLQIDTAGTYRFRLFADDHSRLFIDGVEVASNLTAGAFHEASAIRENLSTGPHVVAVEYANTAGEAMVNLDWYRCPNGPNDCNLNITPKYQTSYTQSPMPLQCDKDESATIAAYGCTITSFAMALQSFGLDIQPTDLNQWLSENSGYRDTDQPNCDQRLKDYNDIVTFAGIRSSQAVQLVWRPTANAAEVIGTKHLPVLMKATWSCTNPAGCPTHFVLATDVAAVGNQNTLGINDPYHSFGCSVDAIKDAKGKWAGTVLTCSKTPQSLQHASTQIEAANYYPALKPIGYLAPLEGKRTASLQINVENAQVQIMDSAGRLAGFDPSTGLIRTEIPNSFYFDPSVIPPTVTPAAISASSQQNMLFLPDKAEGTYTLRLYTSPSALSTLTSVTLGAIMHDSELKASSLEWSQADGDTIYTQYQVTIGQNEGLIIEPAGPPIAGQELRSYLPFIVR